MNIFQIHYYTQLFSTIKAQLAESPIAYRLARGAFWSLIGGVISRILIIVTSVIIARMLGKTGYGEMGMVQSTMGMFGVFAGMGLGMTATKYIAEYRSTDPVRAGRIAGFTIIGSLLCSLVMMLVSIEIAPWLAATTMNRADMAPLLVAGSLLMFISTIGGVISATLSGFESFRKIAKINIWQGAIAPLIAMPCVWFYGVQGAIASVTITAAIGLILCSISLRQEFIHYGIRTKYWKGGLSEWPILWKYALPSVLSGVMYFPAVWFANSVLVKQPGGYGELGLFNAANQLRMGIILLPTLLTSAMLPILSEAHGREDQSDFFKTISLNLRGTWIVALPLTVVVITFGRLLASMFGRDFVASVPMIGILMISCFLYVVSGTLGTALAGSGRMWTGTFINIAWVGVFLVSALLLIPRFGGIGLSYAYLLAYLLHTIWSIAYIELYLARYSVLNQWPLMIFTAIILLLSFKIGTGMSKHYLISFIIVLISLAPLFNVVKDKLIFRNYNIQR